MDHQGIRKGRTENGAEISSKRGQVTPGKVRGTGLAGVCGGAGVQGLESRMIFRLAEAGRL